MRAVVTLLALLSLLWQQWGDRCHTCEECAVALHAPQTDGSRHSAACWESAGTAAAPVHCDAASGPLGGQHEEHDSEACPRRMVRGALPANPHAGLVPSMESAPAFVMALCALVGTRDGGLARLDRRERDAFVRAPLRAELNVWRL